MGVVQMDVSRWPLVVARYPDVLDDASQEAHFDDIRALLRRNERYAILLDLRRVSHGADAKQRRRYADFLEETSPDLARLCLGTAYLTESLLTRGVLTAVLWLKPPVYPHMITGDEGKAMEWLHQKLDGEQPAARAP